MHAVAAPSVHTTALDTPPKEAGYATAAAAAILAAAASPRRGSEPPMKTSRGNDSICVFVDKLTKMVHFVACKEKVSAKKFAELYVDHVFRLHGLSRESITDRDVRFTSAFWQELTELLGTRIVMSSSFHPQTDGQTERVNLTLETCL
jgi:hypothetical protein